MRTHSTLSSTFILGGVFCSLALACDHNVAADHDTDRPDLSQGPADSDDQGSGVDDGSQANNDEDPASDPDPEPQEEPFQPTEGIWTVTSGAVTYDGCKMGEYLDFGVSGATSELNLLGGGRFEILAGEDSEYSDGGVVFNCALDDGDCFTCDPLRGTSNEPESFGLSAAIDYTIDLNGCFLQTIEMETETMFSADCVGPDCGTVEFFIGTDFPCDMDMNGVSETDES